MIYGYCLMIPGPDQRALIGRFVAARGCVLSACFEDSADVRDDAWLERPAARELTALLRRGDEVVAAGLNSICTGRRDTTAMLRTFQESGIVLHFAWVSRSLPMSVSLCGADIGKMIETFEVFAALDADYRSQAIKEGLRTRRLRGERHTRFPGYGNQWKRYRGQQYCAADENERAVIRQIVALRDAGASWYRIALHLLRTGVRTAAGREWSPSRVRRAHLAATRGRSRRAT
jgi:DNA invertase Pin-like site-specific DNA recombinase